MDALGEGKAADKSILIRPWPYAFYSFGGFTALV